MTSAVLNVKGTGTSWGRCEICNNIDKMLFTNRVLIFKIKLKLILINVTTALRREETDRIDVWANTGGLSAVG